MYKLPTELLHEILSYCPTIDLHSTRLVNRRWKDSSNAILRNVHSPLQFISTREVTAFMQLIQSDPEQFSFVSKFAFDFSGISLNAVQRFASLHGHCVKALNFNPTGARFYTNLKKYSAEERFKLCAFLKYSTNLESLLISSMLDVTLDYLLDENSLPLYQNLTQIECYKFEVAIAKIYLEVVQKAPNLQIFKISNPFPADMRNLTAFAILLQRLAKHVVVNLPLRLDQDIVNDNFTLALDSLNRMTNRIQIFELFVDAFYLQAPVGPSVENFLVSQSQRLETLAFDAMRGYIADANLDQFTIPSLPALKFLGIGPRYQWLKRNSLTPDMFPKLSTLAFMDPENDNFLTNVNIWPTITTLQVRCSRSHSCLLTPQMCAALPNLRVLELQTETALVEDVKVCIQNCLLLDTLVIGFWEYGETENIDLWNVFTGGKTQIELEDLLTQEFTNEPVSPQLGLSNLSSLQVLRIKNCSLNAISGILFLTKADLMKLQCLEILFHPNISNENHKKYLEILSKHGTAIIKYHN